MGLIRFFAFGPRVTRMRWAAWFAAILAGILLCGTALTRSEGIALVLLYAVIGALSAKLATESVRRLHDCGQSGRVGVAPAFGIVALLVCAVLHAAGYGPGVVSWGLSALAMLAIAALLLRRGTAGVNRYGPAPRARVAGTGVGRDAGRAGALVAAGLVVAGLAFGFGVLRWQQDRRQQAERRMDPAFGITDRSAPPPIVPNSRAARPAPQADTPPDTLDDENAALSNRIDALLNMGGTR